MYNFFLRIAPPAPGPASPGRVGGWEAGGGRAMPRKRHARITLGIIRRPKEGDLGIKIGAILKIKHSIYFLGCVLIIKSVEKIVRT